MLKVYTLEESNKWDTVVRSFSEYDVYWLSGYSKGFKLHGDGEPLLFYYENRHIRGINVVFKRDISKVTFFKGKLPIHILIFPLPMVMVVGLSKVKDTMNCLVHLKIGVEKTVL